MYMYMFLKENTQVCVKEKCLVHHHRRMQRGVAGRRMRWGVADNTEDTRGYRRERVVRCLNIKLIDNKKTSTEGA